MAESAVDQALRLAREVQPDLWERTEAIARIIDPSAFMDGWIVEPKSAAKLLTLKLKVKQSAAMSKAQEVLTYLGVNTEADWFEILRRMASETHEG